MKQQPPTIPRYAGTRYVVPLREGGSLPAVVETDGGGTFVVKFRGAGQGPKALVAEALVAGSAGRSACRCRRPAHRRPGRRASATASPTRRSRTSCAAASAPNFGLALPARRAGLRSGGRRRRRRPSWPPTSSGSTPTSPTSTARRATPTCWSGSERLWLIDHGAALYVHHRWAGWQRAHPVAVPADQATTCCCRSPAT